MIGLRIQSTVSDLDQGQWDMVQRSVKTSYEFGPKMTRVCVTFQRDDLERHAEMPIGAYVEILARVHRRSVAMSAATRALRSVGPTAVEVHNLDAEEAAVLADSANQSCCRDHGALLVRETPSMFEGFGPVRVYGDGCESYGPYSSPEETDQNKFDQDEMNTRPAGADQ